MNEKYFNRYSNKLIEIVKSLDVPSTDEEMKEQDKIILQILQDADDRKIPPEILINKTGVNDVKILVYDSIYENKHLSLKTLPLIEAIRKNNFQAVRLLLEYGGDPNIAIVGNANSDRPNTSLDYAIYYNNPEIINLLLEYGATEMNFSVGTGIEEDINRSRMHKRLREMKNLEPGGSEFLKAEKHFHEMIS